MPEDNEFTLLASEGGLFLINADSGEKTLLTKEQFEKLLFTKTFTKSSMNINPDRYGEWLSMQIESYIEQRKSGKSVYGERVILHPIRVEETVEGKAVSINGLWKCITESGQYLHDAEIIIKNLTGPIATAAINAHLSVAEILKTIIQLDMSGAFATDEDEKPMVTLFKLMSI